MSSGKLLLGVLAGVAAGAVIGILLAPDKGSVTRRKISKKGDDYVDALKDKFNDLLESVTDSVETAKKEAEVLIEKGKSKAYEIKNAVHEKMANHS